MNRHGNIGLWIMLLGAVLAAVGSIVSIADDIICRRNLERENTKKEIRREAINEIRREAILREVATFVVDIDGVASFVWLVPIRAEKAH